MAARELRDVRAARANGHRRRPGGFGQVSTGQDTKIIATMGIQENLIQPEITLGT